MKTAYKIAKKLGQEFSITPQAVYKKIKQLNNELVPHVINENGKIFYNDSAEQILRESFITVNQPVVEQLSNELGNQLSNQVNSEVEFLKEQNKFYQEEIKLLQAELKIEREHNRDISNKLIELTNNSQELTRNSQVLLKQEQDKTALLLPEQEEKKKGFFKKIFNKNK